MQLFSKATNASSTSTDVNKDPAVVIKPWLSGALVVGRLSSFVLSAALILTLGQFEDARPPAEAAEAQLTRTRAELSSFQVQLDSLVKQRDALAPTVADWEKRLKEKAAAEAGLATAAGKLRQTESDIQQTTKRLDDTNQNSANAEKQKAELPSELEKLKADVSSLTKTKVDAKALLDQAAHAELRLNDAQSALIQVQKDREKLNTDVATLRQQSLSLKDELTALQVARNESITAPPRRQLQRRPPTPTPTPTPGPRPTPTPTPSGNTITAATGFPTDVQAAINLARNGYTVIIPNGNYDWRSGVTVSKFITLTAQTLGGVTITDDYPSGNLINWTTNSAGHTTIAGIHFLVGTNTNVNYSKYISLSDGTSPQVAILHDCTFQVPSFTMAMSVDWQSTGGLIYNCTFDGSLADGGNLGPGSLSDAIRIISRYPWYNASTFGNLDSTGLINCYIESCTFISCCVGIDVDDRARVVVRHCTFANSGGITHGITSLWGGRQVELYNNNFQYFQVPPSSVGAPWVNMSRYWWFRAGTGRIWGNKVQTIWSNHFWNATSSWVATDEPLTRPGSGNNGAVETDATYPGTRWPGTGSNGTTKYPPSQATGIKVSPSFVDPIYIWGNTNVPSQIGGGNTDPGEWWGTVDQSGFGRDPVPGKNQTSDVFKLNRDIFLSAPNNNPSPAYTPYVYPHPLDAGRAH
jgi:predicted  nucleic acid-binding Zn-ribbon protein